MFSAKENKPYLLTVKDKKYLLPVIQIEHSKYFHKEIFSKIKTLFLDDEIRVNEDCSYNFIDIQQQLSLDYIFNNKEYYGFIEEDDLIITYGGIIQYFNVSDQFDWSEYVFNDKFGGYSADNNLNLMLDNIITRTKL